MSASEQIKQHLQQTLKSQKPSSDQPGQRTEAVFEDNEYISSSHISCKLFDPFGSRNCTKSYTVLAENHTLDR